MLALVERLGDVPRQHGVYCAHQDKQDGIPEGDHVGSVHVGATDQEVILSGGVVVDGSGRRDDHPHGVDQHLVITTEEMRGKFLTSLEWENVSDIAHWIPIKF